MSPANAGQLTRAWAFTTGGLVAASATVVGGLVYVGSWDGYEYAIDAATGTERWKTFLGITTGDPVCDPRSAGVTSTATVQDGIVYLGGGDAYWYALDASTGSILWRVFTGDNSATGGHYNWSSPLVFNGYAYLGIASLADCPLVQGQVLQVSLSSHQVVNTFNIVPNGQVGGGIWTSPSADPASNTIYVTTGNGDTVFAFTQSIIALDATTLALKGSWAVPPANQVNDSDWGTTPIVFDDTGGRRLVAAINKNGIAYAFNRNDLNSGPIWQQRISTGGECPTCGDGSVSSGAFGNGLLYFGGGNTVINGVATRGSVRALDPATGAIVWQHPDPAPVIAALAYANGLILDGTGPTLEVLDAASGAPLWSHSTGGAIYGAPGVAEGMVFAGSVDHSVYAFSLPAAMVHDLKLTAPASATAGQAFPLTVTAENSQGSPVTTYSGTVHFSSTDTSPSVTLPPDSTLTNGQATFSVTLVGAGSQSVTVSDAANALATTVNLTVNPGAASRLLLDTPTTAPTAGVSFPFTVTAKDPFGNTDPSYAGTVHFNTSDPSPNVVLPPDSALANGQGTFSATLDRVGSQTLTATDTVAPSLTGALSITIHAAGAATLSLSAPASATANQPFDITVTLLDPFGNVADGYAGTVQFTTSDPLAQLPADYQFTGADGGTHGFTITLMTPTPASDGQTITVTDGADASLSATSPPIVVNAA